MFVHMAFKLVLPTPHERRSRNTLLALSVVRVNWFREDVLWSEMTFRGDDINIIT